MDFELSIQMVIMAGIGSCSPGNRQEQAVNWMRDAKGRTRYYLEVAAIVG